MSFVHVAAVFLRAGTSNGQIGCSNGEAHWLQPNLMPSHVQPDPSLLASTNSDSAYCFPSAAASLLSKLAYDGKWTSQMTTRYPTHAAYTEKQPWADYAWHTQGALSLGSHMKTNAGALGAGGTTIENGKKGIENFVQTVDPSKRAVVTVHNGPPLGSNVPMPLLLHLKTDCLRPQYDLMNSQFNEDNGVIKLSQSQEVCAIMNGDHNDNIDNCATINGNLDRLGHTVVAYSRSASANGDIFRVAMNVPTTSNVNGTACTATQLLLPSNDEHNCIEKYTTVDIVDAKKDDTGLSAGAIVGIAIGSSTVVAVAMFFICQSSSSSDNTFVRFNNNV